VTDEELAKVWAWLQEDQDPEALEILTVHYEPLARYLARRALAKAPAFQDREDMLSYAHHGLLDAIKKFEPGRGIKFETYASRRITGEIIDGLRKQDPLTRQMRKRVSALRDAQVRHWDASGREATVEQLAAALDESVTAVRELMVTQQTLTKELDESFAGDSGAALVATETEHEVEAEEDQMMVGLSRMLPRLSERDRTFLVLYYCEKRSLRDIGKQFGVSDSRCAQIRRDMLQSMLNPA
jgi:RNA polymerase sigma factor for flagellar operon FliA